MEIHCIQAEMKTMLPPTHREPGKEDHTTPRRFRKTVISHFCLWSPLPLEIERLMSTSLTADAYLAKTFLPLSSCDKHSRRSRLVLTKLDGFYA